MRPTTSSMTWRWHLAARSRAFYYSPFKGNESKDIKLDFKRGEGVDQFGREQVLGPEPKGGAGVWEHRMTFANEFRWERSHWKKGSRISRLMW